MPNPWPDGLELLPSSAAGAPTNPLWEYSETDWYFALQQLRDGAGATRWRVQLQVFHYPDPSETLFDTAYAEWVPGLEPPLRLEWAGQIGSPGVWLSSAEFFIEPVTYDQLPADWCTGE